MNLQQFRIFLHRYASQKSTDEEARVFDDFFASYQEAEAAPESAVDAQQRGEALYKRLEQQVVARKTHVHPLVRRIAAAAVLLLSAGLGAYWYYGSRPALLTVQTGRGERRDVRLPDGSVVVLNAGSRLSYPAAFQGMERAVILEGEGFFKVKRNPAKPFVVRTAALQTTVLGTSFDVTAYSGEPGSVIVATGKVRVAATAPGGAAVVLLPNQQALQQPDGGLAVQRVRAADFTAWQEGVLYLQQTTLPVLAKTLERKYGVHIRLAPGVARSTCTVNGRLADDRLPNVLESLHFSSNLEYSLLNDTTVQFSAISCN